MTPQKKHTMSALLMAFACPEGDKLAYSIFCVGGAHGMSLLMVGASALFLSSKFAVLSFQLGTVVADELLHVLLGRQVQLVL